MKEFKGTPGPWSTDTKTKQMAVVAKNRMVAEVPRQHPNAAANLKAIAALPQMLEALQILTDYFEWLTGDLNFPAYIQAKAALSAALD